LLSKGEKINKYEIIEEIARGGEACIYRVLDTFKNKKIALKVIHEFHARQDPEITRLFLREGKILSEIDNPGIIKVYESNVANVAGRDLYYHAIELIEDETLDDYLKRNSPDWRKTVRIIRAIAEIVAMLHERELPVLHRDLKPSNIFLLDAGDSETPAKMKIFDFGLARFEFERTITAPDAFRGTLKYSAPELKRVGGKASKASDIYSLGRTLEEMLGETVASDVPRWILSLKEIMCDASSGNRPSAREILDIIDEQTHSGSSIFASTTKLSAIRNRIRIKKHQKLIKISAYLILVFALVFLIYQLIPRPAEIDFNIKPNQAQVFLDSEEQNLNDGESHRITPGNHTLRFERDGYCNHYKEIHVNSNDKITCNIDLKLYETPLVNWMFDIGKPEGKSKPFLGHPMIFDSRGDGRYEVVVASSHQMYRINGISGVFEEIWPSGIEGMVEEAGPAHFDCNDDGCEDIIFAISGYKSDVLFSTVVCISGDDNSLIWPDLDNQLQLDDVQLSSSVSVIQIKEDGEHVIVVPTSNGKLYLLDTTDGRPVWEKESSLKWQNHVEFNAILENSTPAFYDFNNDGFLDIVICTAEPKDTAYNPEYLPAGTVIVSGEDGSELAHYPTSKIVGSPGIADLNADRKPEIVVATLTGVIHIMEYSAESKLMKSVQWEMKKTDGTFNCCSSSPVFFIDPISPNENDVRFAIANHSGEIGLYDYDGKSIIKIGNDCLSLNAQEIWTEPLGVKVHDSVLFAKANINAGVFWHFYPTVKSGNYKIENANEIWHGLLAADIDLDGGMELVTGTIQGQFVCVNAEEDPVDYVLCLENDILNQPVITMTAQGDKKIYYPTRRTDGAILEIGFSDSVPVKKVIPKIGVDNAANQLLVEDFDNDGVEDVFITGARSGAVIYSPEKNANIWEIERSDYWYSYGYLLETDLRGNIFIFSCYLPEDMRSGANFDKPVSMVKFLRWDENENRMVSIIDDIKLDYYLPTCVIPYRTGENEQYVAFLGNENRISPHLNKIIQIRIDDLFVNDKPKYNEKDISGFTCSSFDYGLRCGNDHVMQIDQKSYFLYSDDSYHLGFFDLENAGVCPCPWPNQASVTCSMIQTFDDLSNNDNKRIVILDTLTNSLVEENSNASSDTLNVFKLIAASSGEILDEFSFIGDVTAAKCRANVNDVPVMAYTFETDTRNDSSNETRIKIAQILAINQEANKFKLLWSHRIPEIEKFNPLIADFYNDGTYSIMLADINNNIHFYPISPINAGVFQFRGDRKIFDPEKWKKQ